MSTKNQTTTTNSYDPNSLSTYRNLQGPSTTQLGQQITDPNSNSLMNKLRQRGSIASAGFSRGPAPFNPSASSPSNSAAFGRAVAGYGAQTNNNLLIGGAQLRNQALGAAMQYRPLQTGGTQVQSTSGLGTWLPSVIGMGLGAFGIKSPLHNADSGGGGGPMPPGYNGGGSNGGDDGYGGLYSGNSSTPSGGGNTAGNNDDVWGLG